MADEPLQIEPAPAPKNKGGRPAKPKPAAPPARRVCRSVPGQEGLDGLSHEPSPLEPCIVARGKTVVLPHPTEKIPTHRLENGTLQFGPRPVEHAQGSEIELPEEEVARLRGLGVLLLKGQRWVESPDGPRIEDRSGDHRTAVR
jgi:hypothetical protein